MGPNIFRSVLKERMDSSHHGSLGSEDLLKQKITQLMNYAHDCQGLRDIMANRKARSGSHESGQGWLLYTIDGKDKDERPEEREEP